MSIKMIQILIILLVATTVHCVDYDEYNMATLSRRSKPKSAWQNMQNCGQRPIWQSNSTNELANHGPITRMIGGSIASLGQFPSFVRLIRDGTNYTMCGGLIVDNDMIITAAHCLLGEKLDQVRVVAGIVEHEDKKQVTEQVHNIKSVCYHPELEATWVEDRSIWGPDSYDIATVKLDGKFIFNEYVQPACLSINEECNSKLRPTNETFVATGWGLKADIHQVTNPMKLVSKELKYMNITYTEDQASDGFRPFKSSLSTDRGNHADSGSPVYYERAIDGQVRQFAAGIISGERRFKGYEVQKFFEFESKSPSISSMLANHDLCARNLRKMYILPLFQS